MSNQSNSSNKLSLGTRKISTSNESVFLTKQKATTEESVLGTNQSVLISNSSLKTQLQIRKSTLNQVLRSIKKDKTPKPRGKLRVDMKKGKPQYYRIIDSTDTRGKYIKKKDIGIAMALAQKNYNSKLQEIIKEEIEGIDRLLVTLNQSPEELFKNLNLGRKNLIKPYLIDDEEYISRWISEPFETDKYYPEDKIYETNSGEIVRSKSEIMIANAYDELGIPYRYEAKLPLKNGKYRFPDFTVLDVKNRKIIYHEHFGRLDDEDYRFKNLRKLEDYREAGIILGKNLIVTYETSITPFNIHNVKQMLKEIFEV